jgi:hypothetical protein
MNSASRSSAAVQGDIRMRCRAQNSVDANIIQLPHDLPQKPVRLEGLERLPSP